MGPEPVGPAEAGAPLSEAEARELLKPADGSPPGRAELEQSLPRAKEVLLRLLDDPDPQVRAGAASALGGWAAESDVRVSLLDRSKDGALAVGDRSAAILALESVANDVANELLPLLDAREPADVQVAAVRVLSGVDEHRPAVRAFIDSDSAHAAARRLGMQYLTRETTDHSSQ